MPRRARRRGRTHFGIVQYEFATYATYFHRCLFLASLYCPSSITCKKITGNTQTISMNPIAGAAGELGSEFGSTRPQRSGELNAIPTSLQTSRWPFPQLGYMSYSAVQHIRAAQRL